VDGETYARAFDDGTGVVVARVRQPSARSVDIVVEGRDPECYVAVVERMLGLRRSLRSWYRHAAAVPWVHELSRRFLGLKPPCYPTLWEALCHAIVFQQISLHAASSIMRRVVEQFSPPVESGGRMLFPFPAPGAIAQAADAALRACGLSAPKISALREASAAVLDGRVDAAELDGLTTAEACARLTALRGIGPWSATVVMLRGAGRLELFPRRDSGVAASLKLLSGNRNLDAERLLDELGDQRGMLYFHLLLGRLALADAKRAATNPGL